jgi:prepilin peptidase CpaA
MVLFLLTCVVFITTLASCVSDLRRLRIPNAHVLIVMAAFALAYIVSPEFFGRWWEHLAAFAIVFIVTYAMFAFGMIGGGDAKLGAALALWVGLKGLMPFMFYMAIVGGLLGIAALMIRKNKPFKNCRDGSWVSEVQLGKNAVPYGIAITFGAWAGMFYTGFLTTVLHEVIKIIH